MPQLLLQRIEPSSAVQEVDGVPVPEQVSMYISLKPGIYDIDELLLAAGYAPFRRRGERRESAA